MSEIKLILVDAERAVQGTIHGSVADACIAALSAEPETVAELEAALARYIKPRDAGSCFASLRSEVFPASSPSDVVATFASSRFRFDTEPWDAGVVVVDLASRIVAGESSYSQPGPEGEVFYHDGEASTDLPVLYRVPEDWLFVSSVDAWQWSRERRISERVANPAIDARPILFGRPLLQFIVNACISLPDNSRRATDAQVSAADDESPGAWAEQISGIHARWLLTPREDLRGKSPRDVLLAQQDQIDFDLHTRSLQWSVQNEGPPCLSVNSFAYRCAGFGTHEYVVYYDLIRHLIGEVLELLSRETVNCDERHSVERFVDILEHIKTNWLENPQTDLGGHIPAIIIDNERKRLPQALRPRDMIVDDDCPMCQMFGDETSPLGMGVGFWHLDGSHMDDEFAFSHYKTRQEWENENRRREEFNREFDRKWEERQQRIARGEPIETDPFFEPEPFELELE